MTIDINENWKQNKDITNVESKSDKLIITYKNGRPAEVPAIVNGKPISFIDPYDTKTGKGVMIQNKILDSNLSTYAKLCYCALRRAIIHKVGFTFINIKATNDEQKNLMQLMSVGSRNTVRNAQKELKYFRVIDIGEYFYKGIQKNIYVFLPETEWNLPDKEAAEAYGKLLKQQEKQRKEARAKERETDDNIKKLKDSGIFVFEYGKYKGLTMEQVYEEDCAYVFKQASEAHTDIVRTEAQRVIDEMEEIPI